MRRRYLAEPARFGVPGTWVRPMLLAMLLALATVAGLVAAVPPAAAVEFVVLENQGRRALLIRDEPKSEKFPRGGMIMRGDAQRFAQELQRVGKIDEILFDSGGGSEPDGLELGRLIRKAGLSTRIPAGAMCASACADAFLGGVSRRVDKGGRYGIHMPTIASNPATVQKIAAIMEKARSGGSIESAQRLIFEIEQLSAQAAARWALYVMSMGASIRIVDSGAKYLASEMNWLTREQLIDLNVVNVD
jgi:hypothetical protein